MLRIVGVKAEEEYGLKIKFNNGSELTLDMASKVETVRFRQLKDKELFESVSTDGYCIHWNELIEISVSEVIEIAQVMVSIKSES